MNIIKLIARRTLKFFKNLFFKEEKMEIDNLEVSKRNNYISISFNFKMNEIRKLDSYIFEIVEKTLNDNKIHFLNEEKKYGSEYSIILLSLMSFESEEKWKVEMNKLVNVRLQSFDDSIPIKEFSIKTQESIIEKIERYNIKNISSIIIKII